MSPADAGPLAIPIVDLSNATSPDLTARQAIAEELRRACCEIGFFYVRHHGVPSETIDKAFQAAHRFFRLPDDAKNAISLHKSDAMRGYNALLSENVDPANRGDLNEGFNVGPPSTSFGTSTGDANQWPVELEGTSFRSDVMAYYDAVNGLAARILPLLALALKLPEDFFADKTRSAANVMRLLRYPPQTGPVTDQMGIGAHTDYEVITILAMDENPALQVRTLDGKWIDANPIPGTFVCNLGDQLARWTNDVFLSTTHRAINRTGKCERYSIPLFVGTDYDVIIEPLPSCVSADRPARYAPISAGAFVQKRLADSYKPVEA